MSTNTPAPGLLHRHTPQSFDGVDEPEMTFKRVSRRVALVHAASAIEEANDLQARGFFEEAGLAVERAREIRARYQQ